MHTGPMHESSGTFQEPLPQRFDCPFCKERECVVVRVWESSCGGYEDEKHECLKCRRTWWIEGADA